MTQSSKEQVDQFNLDMERRLMDFDLPEHPGLWRNFDAYLKMLGCDDGKPTVEQSRRAKIQLAQQGNIFFGTVLGRAGAKSVINGFQRGLAKRAREAAAKLRTNEWWEMDVDLPIT